jgi:hypothetical protein
VNLPTDDHLAEIWAAERKREILRRAVRTLYDKTRIDPRTVRAFELLVFHQRIAGEAAAELSMTVNDVYLAKHRCLKRLRPIVDEIRAEYDADS